MPPKRKSKSDRKSKEDHHSRNHRNRRSNRNKSEFVEPLYFVDPMLPHSFNPSYQLPLPQTTNVPLFIQTPMCGPSHSSWNPISPVVYINPSTPSVFPNAHHPSHLTIGPLYLLSEGGSNTSNVNPVILEGAQLISVDKNRPMVKHNPHERITNAVENEKPVSVNVVSESYNLPTRNEATDVVNRWKSHNRARNILVDTPTQYEYQIPTSKRKAPKRLRVEKSVGNSESSNLISAQSNESWKQLSETESSDLVFSEHSRGDITVMRLVGREDIDQDVGLYDLGSPNKTRYSRTRPSVNRTYQSTEPSKLHRVLKSTNRESIGRNRNNHRQIYVEVPVGINNLNKERYTLSSVKNGNRYDPRKMNIKTEYNKPLNSTNYQCMKRRFVKPTNFRDMTTEDSINDLYRKINDIQSSLGPSSVNGFLAGNADHEARDMTYPVPFEQSVYPKPLGYYDSDIVVSGTNTITSPINFKTIENTGSCCCCQQCTSKVEEGLRSPILTRDIDTLTEFPTNFNQCLCCCRPETGHPNPNDGIRYFQMFYPQANSSFRSDLDFAPKNKNIRVIIDQESETQSPSIPQIQHDSSLFSKEEICNRPCNCPENPVPHLDQRGTVIKSFSGGAATNLSELCFATKDNSTSFSLPDLPATDESRSASVQTSKAPTFKSLQQFQSCPCQNIPKSCHCDLNKELFGVMGQIEDNIISKLERRKSLLKRNSRRSSLGSSIKENLQRRSSNKEHLQRRSSKVKNRESEISDEGGSSTRLEESIDTSASKPIIIDHNGSAKERNYRDSSNELNDFNDNRNVIVKKHPQRKFIISPRESTDSEYPFEDKSENTLRNESESAQDKKKSNLGRRSTRFSSFLKRRSTRKSRKGFSPRSTSEGSGRRSTHSTNSVTMSRRQGRTLGGGGYKLKSPAFANFGKRDNRTPETNVLTAIPYVENDTEVSKDGISSDNYVENDTLLFTSIVKQDEKNGRNCDSYQIRRLKLQKPKKHVYVLVKKRNDRKNILSQESEETFNISSVKNNSFKGVTDKKILSLKGVKSKKLHKIYLKSDKEKRDKRTVSL